MNKFTFEISEEREIHLTNNRGVYMKTSETFCNTKRRHGLYVCSLPQFDKLFHVLLSSLDETIIYNGYDFELAQHKYPGCYHPQGSSFISHIEALPYLAVYYCMGPVALKKEFCLPENDDVLYVKYTVHETNSNVELRLNPLMAFRNIYSTAKHNFAADTRIKKVKHGISATLYPGFPNLNIQVSANATFIEKPDWNYNHEYKDFNTINQEDLFTPGYFSINMVPENSVVVAIAMRELNPKNFKNVFSQQLDLYTTTNKKTTRKQQSFSLAY